MSHSAADHRWTNFRPPVHLSVLPTTKCMRVSPPEGPYLVDILRYSVHLLGPGHPGWRVSPNHPLKFLQMRLGLLSLDGAAASPLLSSPLCGDWARVLVVPQVL